MYLEWSLSRMESRTEAMLSLLGVRFEPHPVRLVQAITPPLMTLLEQPAFRGKREMGVDTVSEHGIAVGFDLGLLLCRVILRVADPTFVVTVLRKPKSDLFYNKLVLRPSDDRWRGATWSPEHIGSVAVAGFVNRCQSPDDLPRIVRDIVAQLI